MVENDRTFMRRSTEGHSDREPTSHELGPELAYKLARGVENAIGEPLRELTKNLRDTTHFSKDDETLANPMKEAGNAIRGMLDQLKTSTRTELRHESLGFNFSFSESTYIPPNPEDGIVQVPSHLTEAVVKALAHNIGNKTTIFGMYRHMENPPLSTEEQDLHTQSIIEWLGNLQDADSIQLKTFEGVTMFVLPTIEESDALEEDVA